MHVVKSARFLADYIESLPDLTLRHSGQIKGYTHIGGLFTDIILQAGLNYKYIVKPRVERVMLSFPKAYNVTNFCNILNEHGIENVINWSHPIKIKRLEDLLNFCLVRGIESCEDLHIFLRYKDNRTDFTSLHGFGPKTLDYTMKLLNFDVVAVDRHIISFLENAGIEHINYNHTKNIVEFAADLLKISRSSLDASIWYYMSEKFKEDSVSNNIQLELAL